MQTFKITIDHRDFIVLCLPNRPKALLDRTVAEIYEVETMHINQAVRRNPEKFPEDFYFELTIDEVERIEESMNCYLKDEVVPNWYHLNKSHKIGDLKYSPHLPKAFTHLGCNMLATILKSKRAVQRAIQIIRTFTALESGGYDRAIRELQKGQQNLTGTGRKAENIGPPKGRGKTREGHGAVAGF